MDVFWLEQSEADLPASNDWLSASERAGLNAMRVPKRRADWRLGRWTAKRALSAYLKLPDDHHALTNIEIRPAASGAPEAFIGNRSASAAISLSHCNGNALCAVAPFATVLGCDLELVEPRSDAFVADYFTAEEQELVAQASAADRSYLPTLLWSAKESALKALHEGLRLDTRSVAVSLPDGSEAAIPNQEASTANPDSAFGQRCSGWRPLDVRCTSGEMFRGWWQRTGNLLRTLVAAPAPNSPIVLRGRRASIADN
jgi:4'-phosphopantetheinyl transferase